jgi:hypothetical protein
MWVEKYYVLMVLAQYVNAVPGEVTGLEGV